MCSPNGLIVTEIMLFSVDRENISKIHTSCYQHNFLITRHSQVYFTILITQCPHTWRICSLELYKAVSYSPPVASCHSDRFRFKFCCHPCTKEMNVMMLCHVLLSAWKNYIKKQSISGISVSVTLDNSQNSVWGLWYFLPCLRSYM